MKFEVFASVLIRLYYIKLFSFTILLSNIILLSVLSFNGIHVLFLKMRIGWSDIL